VTLPTLPTNGTANPNIYFMQSTDGERRDDWSQRIQVSVETTSTPTGQWQPAITVKPDGTKLFVGWSDRRNELANNSLIQTCVRLGRLGRNREMTEVPERIASEGITF